MSIVLEELTKRYAGHPVVNGISLTVGDGELFVLLGSSGSGKSTLLRMIAGLTEVDAGRVTLHGRDVTELPPARRGVGFVFQSYALFPSLSVAENVEFALAVRGAAREVRRQRRDELLELVGLAGLGGRLPRQLSGGQQQRVALARALAHQPEVLLLDEPFGALDAKVRADLRRTIREIQRELGVTTLFVTHDQDEAFELADRLAVLSFGRLLEAGLPEELYLRPETEFVATFLGTANLLVGEATSTGVKVGPVCFPLGTHAEPRTVGVADTPDVAGRRVQVLFRPEDVAVRASADDAGLPLLGQAVVDQRAFIGSFERLRLRLPALPGVRAIAPVVPFGSDSIWIEATRSQDQARRFPLRPGDTTWVGVRRVHALVHPGMRFLLLTDGSAPARAALALGGELARLAHARVTVLAPGTEPGEETDRRLQESREQLGSGVASLESRATGDETPAAVAEETSRRPCDLVILGHASKEGVKLAEEVISAGHHHLLLVPPGASGRAPERWLICVAVGEPGKADVSFAGRLARHLRAEATILTVLPPKIFDFRIMPDFGAGQTVLQDAYIEGRFSPAFRVRAGKFKPPVGLERLQSGADLLFVERALPTNLVPNRDLGVQIAGDFGGGVASYQIGVFNGVVDGGIADADTNSEKDVAARLFFQPFVQGSGPLKNLGFGIAGTSGNQSGTPAAPGLPSYRSPGQATVFAYRSDGTAPNTTIADGRHVRIVPQAYLYSGRFGLLAEYASSRQDVTRGAESRELDHRSWQAAASWVITGGVPTYRSVDPKVVFDPAAHTWGAWEVKVRVSKLDVDPATFPVFANPATAIRSEQAVAVGLNWYLNRNVRLLFDYERTTYDGGFTTGDREDEKIFFSRFQIQF